MKNKHSMFTQEGRTLLEEEYIQKERSPYDIAEGLGLYANLIRRALIFHGFEIRDHGEAQKKALKTGRHPHPTKKRINDAPEG